MNNRNIRKSCKICSKLTIKIPERLHLCSSGKFIVNFEHVSQLFSNVSVLDFEHVFVCWVWLTPRNSKMPSYLLENCLNMRACFFYSLKSRIFQGCVRYIFASLFFMSKRETCETRKRVFYFTLKALFISDIIKF